MKLRLITIVFLLGLFVPSYSWAQQDAHPLLLINGGDNSANYKAFTQAVALKNSDNQINLLIFPFALASDPFQLSDAERAELMLKSEDARREIEAVCNLELLSEVPCSVQAAPLLTHSDAQKEELLAYIDASLDGIYLLSGDPEIADQVIEGTPLQAALNQAYQQAIVVAGSAPGFFSSARIQATGTGAHLDSVFDFGAFNVFEPPTSQSMDFNLAGTIMISNVFDQAQLGTLLRAITMPGAPSMGIGLDEQSQMQVADHKQIVSVTGDAPLVILDAQRYHAAQSARYTGAFQPTGASNILAHWLAAGEQSFDLETHQQALAAIPERIPRNTQPLRLPSGAGSLFLSSDLVETAGLNNAAAQFINQAGGQKARLLFLAIGYQDRQEIQAMAGFFEQLAKIPIQVLELTQDTPAALEIPDDVTGIIASAATTDDFNPSVLQPVGLKWRSGLPVWLNQASISWIGANYVLNNAETNPETNFLLKNTDIQTGLSWLPASFVSHLWDENHWSGTYSLGYYQPQNLVLGIPSRSGLEISSLGARVWGEDAVITIDFSQAVLSKGSTANTLIDIFAPHELISFQDADQNFEPIAASTPALPTATYTQHVVTPTDTPTPTATLTATPIPTETQRVRPTATIKPTHTPPPIPPPPDPARMNFMVVITIIMVVIILFGIWLNRQWIKGNH